MAKAEDVKKIIEIMRSNAHDNKMNHFDENHKGMGVVLKALCEAGEPVSPGYIADATGMTGARVAVLLKKLLEKGFISREHDNKDARKVKVELTSKGHEFSINKEKELEKMLSDIIDDVGIDTFYTLFDCLKKIHASAKQNIEKCKNNIEKEIAND